MEKKICKAIPQTMWMKSDKDKESRSVEIKNMTGHLPLTGQATYYHIYSDVNIITRF